MRLRQSCTVLLGLALAGAALPWSVRAAEIDVGLYADANGTAHSLTVAPNEPFWLYLVIEHPVLELPAALGQPMLVEYFRLRLRCLLEIPANLAIVNFDESLGGLCGPFDQQTDPDIVADYVMNLMYFPTGPLCEIDRCLLRVGLMALDDAPAPIHLRPGSAGGTADGLPTLDYLFDNSYVDPLSGVLGLRPLPSGVDAPVFVVNGGLVPLAGATWGTVKGLYR